MKKQALVDSKLASPVEYRFGDVNLSTGYIIDNKYTPMRLREIWQLWYLKIKWIKWRAFSIKHNLINLHMYTH